MRPLFTLLSSCSLLATTAALIAPARAVVIVDGVNNENRASIGVSRPDSRGVDIELPPEALATASLKQKETVAAVLEVLKGRLLEWSSIQQINLPPSAFDDSTQIITLDSVFKAPDDSDVRNSAAGQPKLSEEQLASISETAVFKVPSAGYPGRFHVWKLNIFFQSGAKNISLRWKKTNEVIADQIYVQLPARIFGDHPISVARGLSNIKNGLLEVLSLFVGLSDTRYKYDEAEIARLIDQMRKEAILNEPESTRDTRLFNSDLKDQVRDEIGRIENYAGEKFRADSERVSRTISETLKEKGLDPYSEEFAQALADQLAHSQQEAFYGAIKNSDALEKLSPGLGQYLVDQGHALQLLKATEERYAQKITQVQREVYALAKSQHPEHALDTEWLNATAKAATDVFHQNNLWPMYAAAVKEIRAHGFERQAEAIEQDIAFLRANMETIRKNFVDPLAPAVTQSWDVQIWRKSRWKVEKSADGTYFIKPWKTITVDSTSPLFGLPFLDFGWRINAIGARTVASFKNGVYGILVSNLWNGPLGLRSQFSAKPFSTGWTVTQEGQENAGEPGQIVPNGEMEQTWWSRMQASRAYGDRLYADFEAKDDYGLLGKTGDKIWVNLNAGLLFKFLIPYGLVGLGQPVATAVNTAVSGTLVATSVAWAPVSSLIGWGLDALVYDSLGKREPRFVKGKPAGYREMAWFVGSWRWLPAPYTLASSFTAGTVQTTLGVAGANLHFYGALLLRGFNDWFNLANKAWDFAWMRVISRLGHVQKSNSWIAHRISGPGLDTNYMFRIKPNVFLTAALAGLESQELSYVKAQIERELSVPYDEANEIIKAFELVLGGKIGMQEDSPAVGAIVKARNRDFKALNEMVSELRKKYSSLLDVQRGIKDHLRLGQEDFEPTMAQLTEMTKGFYEGRLFKIWNQDRIAAFWREQGFRPGDWASLAKANMAKQLGSNILSPLGATDDDFVIAVENPDFESFVDGILKAQIPGDFEVKAVNNEIPAERRPQVTPTSRANYVAAGGAELCQLFLLKSEVAVPEAVESRN